MDLRALVVAAAAGLVLVACADAGTGTGGSTCADVGVSSLVDVVVDPDLVRPGRVLLASVCNDQECRDAGAGTLAESSRLSVAGLGDIDRSRGVDLLVTVTDPEGRVLGQERGPVTLVSRPTGGGPGCVQDVVDPATPAFTIAPG